MNPALSRKRRHEAAYARQQEHDVEAGEDHVNVGPIERWLSMFGGGVLVACGLLRGSAFGLAIAALGAGLAYRGYSGHCHLYVALGQSTATNADAELAAESAESAPIG